MGLFLSESFTQVLARTQFRRLWASQVISQVSLNVINFILILRIFEETGSSVAVSLVWLFYALPAALLGPFSGTIIDLANRRKILVATNVAQAAVVLFYLFVGKSIWPIYPIIFAYSLLNQIYVPAEAATLPFLVGRKLLAAANTLFIFTVYGSALVGFGLAGPVVALAGPRLPFIFISFLLVLAALAVTRLPKQEKAPQVRSPADFWQRFLQGYEFIQKQPAVLFPLLLLVFAGILIPMVGVLAPAITVNILGIPLLSASTKLIVPAGIGAIVGALLAVRWLKEVRKKRLIATGIFVAALALLGIALVVPQLPNRSLFASVSMLVLGWAFATTIVPTQTLLQEQTPNNLRGRVFGALNFLITVISILPVLFAATLAEVFGELTLLTLIAVILLVLAFGALNSEKVLQFYYARR